MLIAFSFSGQCWTKIEKTNGGLRGFRTVTESITPGSSMLACYDPGRSKCVFSGGFTVISEDGEIIKYDDFSIIEEEVMKRITRDNTSGSFAFSSDLFVKYSYNDNSDKLTMEIYSTYEAKTLGFI